MCMICIDLDNLTINQATSHLFEMKELIGKEHTKKVLMEILSIVIGNEPPVDLTRESDQMLNDLSIFVQDKNKTATMM